MRHMAVFPWIAVPLAGGAGALHALAPAVPIWTFGVFAHVARHPTVPMLLAVPGALLVLCALGAGWLRGRRAGRWDVLGRAAPRTSRPSPPDTERAAR